MKRKVKKFAEGEMVYDKEDEGLGGAKIKYREDAEGRKYVAGRANPMDRNPQEQRYYSLNNVKSGIGKLLGGKSSPSEDRPTSSGVEDYASMGKQSGAMPAKSTWSGTPDIKEETKTETETVSEPDSVAGKGAENLTKPYKAKSKSKVVSKKELEDSGFQSLRDYLNDKQGKSRKMASGGKTSSASSRGDGIAQRGKTKGRMC